MATNNNAEVAYDPNQADPGNSMSIIGLYWLNKRWISGGGIKPSDNTLYANLRVHYVFHGKDDRRYIHILTRGKNSSEVAKEQVKEAGIWYVNRGPQLPKTTIHTREYFLQGCWERYEEPEIPVQDDPPKFSRTKLDVYFWPAESTITVCETIDKVEQPPVQWQISSNYGAVECLGKIVFHKVQLEQLEGHEKEFAKRSKPWSTVEVVRDLQRMSMRAYHQGDMTTYVIFRWAGHDDGWQYNPKVPNLKVSNSRLKQ
jgi:hypothetical protein